MISVCHVQVLPILSGVQRVMLEIFRHLDRDRFQPHVVCQQPGALSDALAELDIPCHFIPALDRPIDPFRDAQAYGALLRLFREQSFDIVHTHSSKPGILGRIAARVARTPLVIHHVHAFAFHEFTPRPTRWLYGRLERWTGAYADRVIFVNDEERVLAEREGLLPAGKCLTIHNGIDLEPFDPRAQAAARQQFRVAHDIGPRDRVILFAGRVDKPKQPWLLPEILLRLEKLLPDPDWKLAVAGSGPLEIDLRLRLQTAGLSERVRLAGWMSDPTPAFHAADVLLQPSLWEGLPLSVIEGQAAGLPCVGSNVKGIREVVSPETGVLCSPRNAADYAEQLARYLTDPLRRARQGVAARARAHECFDSAVNMRRVGQLYEELCGLEPTAPLEMARQAA
jgi:glycosyltransferase involved in cell wall biosynthesis